MDDDWDTVDVVNTTELTRLENKSAKMRESDLEQERHLQMIQDFLSVDYEFEANHSKLRSSSEWLNRSLNIRELNTPSLLTRYTLFQIQIENSELKHRLSWELLVTLLGKDLSYMGLHP